MQTNKNKGTGLAIVIAVLIIRLLIIRLFKVRMSISLAHGASGRQLARNSASGV